MLCYLLGNSCTLGNSRKNKKKTNAFDMTSIHLFKTLAAPIIAKTIFLKDYSTIQQRDQLGCINAFSPGVSRGSLGHAVNPNLVGDVLERLDFVGCHLW